MGISPISYWFVVDLAEVEREREAGNAVTKFTAFAVKLRKVFRKSGNGVTECEVRFGMNV